MNIKIVFTFLFLCFGLFTSAIAQKQNQLNSNGKKEGAWVAHYPNGKIKYEGTFKNGAPIGEMKRFHENGQLKAILNYQSSGIIKTKLYNQHGELSAEGGYLGNKKDGTWKYHEKGILISSESFQQGIKTGVAKTFYKDGSLLAETNWKEGKEEGISKKYFENGKIKEEFSFAKGKCHGNFTSYFPDGKIAVSGNYKDNYPDSTWTFFNNDGTIKFNLIYKMGNLLNQEVVDSLKTIELEEMEKNKKLLTDPEKLKNNPEYFYQHGRK